MKLSQILILGYGALYFALAGTMEAESINQGYPVLYVSASMVAQVLVVAGIGVSGLNMEAAFTSYWRWIFPLMILEVLVGIWFNVTIPKGEADLWWLNIAFSLWIMAPAYYFNFRVARHQAPTAPSR
jgi:hypothetical protein